jgi:hypothetical protein
MLRDAGAAEIHLRISSPPIKHPCHYGIDMSTREEMIAHNRTVEEVAAELGADSLHYLESLEGVYEAVGGDRGDPLRRLLHRRVPAGRHRGGERQVRARAAEFLSAFPDRVINVHPALLPAFPGLDAVGQALDYGVKVFGVTVHFVDSGVDSGAVIAQRAVELPQAREREEVLTVLHRIEHELLPEAVRRFARGEIRVASGHARRVLVGP